MQNSNAKKIVDVLASGPPILVLISYFLLPGAVFFGFIIATGTFLYQRIFLQGVVLPICLFLGYVNSTKELSGDLLEYSFRYYEISNLTTAQFLEKTIIEGFREPFFSLSLFLSSHSGIPFSGFVFGTTFLAYFMMGLGLSTYGKRSGVSHGLIVITFFCIALNPFIFSLSAHLVRQFLGIALVSFLLLTFTKRSNFEKFLLISTAFNVHVTTIICFPAIVFAFYKDASTRVTRLLSAGMIAVAVGLLFISNTYAVRRIMDSANLIETYAYHEFSVAYKLLSALVFVAATIVFMNGKAEMENRLFAIVIMCCFVFVFWDSASLVQYRYFQFGMCLAPSLLLFLGNWFSKLRIFLWLASGIISILFLNSITRGDWNYAGIDDIFLQIPALYIFSSLGLSS